MGKTGGGRGTNQYKIRGQAKRRSKTVHGYPADRVIKRGQCVWLRAGFDDIWCLEHRQIAPELRQLSGTAPCIAKLGPRLQARLADILPISALGPWVDQVSDNSVRSTLLQRVPPDQLGWATHATHLDVRQWAAEHMPEDQLQWATEDEAATVRQAAATRMPVEQLGWAVHDQDAGVRTRAAKRMPEDQLQWAARDSDAAARYMAAQRMPVDQLAWATKDKSWGGCV